MGIWGDDGWMRKIAPGNVTVGVANNLSNNRNNWNNYSTISNVVGQLAWKNYRNGHTIFDASE
jgi:hypothetical protein